MIEPARFLNFWILLHAAALLADSPFRAAAARNSTRPNLMLILSDQQRWDFDGQHFPMRMPNLQRLATEGVTFSHAFCPSPLCAPSRNALAAGREHPEMRPYYPKNAPLNPNYPIDQLQTFYSALREAGYHTMSSGKDDLMKEKQNRENMMKNGAAKMKTLGFSDCERTQGKRNTIGTPPQPRDIYGIYLASQKGIAVKGKSVDGFQALQRSYDAPVGSKMSHAYHSYLPDELYEDNFVGDLTVRLLRRRPPHKPWFLQVNFPGPHDPFAITSGMERSVAGRTFGRPTGASGGAPGTWKDVDLGRRFYGAECENLDRILGVLLHEIQDEASRTVVCYSSDHGEMLGDDGKWGKQTAAQGSVAVPLVCRGPGIGSGYAVHDPVATLDLSGTFIDYAGASRPRGMTARSLRPVLEGRTIAPNIRRTVRSALKNWVLHITSVSLDGIDLQAMDAADRSALEREARSGRISFRVLGMNCKRPVPLAADNSLLRVSTLSPGLVKAICSDIGRG